MQISKLAPQLGARVTGIDLTAVSPADVRQLRGALIEHSVLVFRDQHIDDAAQVAFSRHFGPLEIFVKKELRENRYPEIMEVADVGNSSNYLSTAQLWHTDGSYRSTTTYITALRALEIAPNGGHTQFATTSGGYAALPESRKRAIEDLRVVHDWEYSRNLVPGLPPATDPERAAVPPVIHPLARVHSGTGKKVLYVGCHAREIVGMPATEGRALLQEMVEWTTQPQFVYQHEWRLGDLVMWDNRGTLHRATPYDASAHRRVMHRTEVSGRAAEHAEP